MAEGLRELFGDNVYGKDGGAVPVESLAADNDLIGIYFSAHWCPPCRGFTPVLANCYKKLKEAGKKFEVVFVSSDQDQEAFEEYYGEMPWLTIGFDPEKKKSLSTKYGVEGIPTLVIVDNNGKEKTRDARQTVAEDDEGENFPWDLL